MKSFLSKPIIKWSLIVIGIVAFLLIVYYIYKKIYNSSNLKSLNQTVVASAAVDLSKTISDLQKEKNIYVSLISRSEAVSSGRGTIPSSFLVNIVSGDYTHKNTIPFYRPEFGGKLQGTFGKDEQKLSISYSEVLKAIEWFNTTINKLQQGIKLT
jgi:hypothetical protein